MDDSLGLVLIALTFFLAGVVKGALGLGLPTIAIGLLGLIMPPASAASLLVLPSVVTNLWQALDGPALRPLLRRLWPMLLASGVMTACFGFLLVRGAPDTARFWLGLALLAYGISGVLRLQLVVPARSEPGFGLAIGAATGVVTGATGVFVMPAVPYLSGIGLGRDALVQAMGLSFSASSLALGLGLWLHGAPAGAGLGWGSVLALLSALPGMWAGGRLRSRISPQAFRRLFFLSLIGLGLHSLGQSLT